MNLNDWEKELRDNNAVSHENVVTTLKEAQAFMAENEGEYDQVMIIFSKNTDGGKIATYWFNGGFHFSKLVFLFQYLTADFLKQMQEDD